MLCICYIKLKFFLFGCFVSFNLRYQKNTHKYITTAPSSKMEEEEFFNYYYFISTI